MEQTALDISAMKFGNFMLDQWLKDEDSFWKRILNSLPCQICMVSVYDTLVKSVELTKWDWRGLMIKEVQQAKEVVLKRCPDADINKMNRLIRAVLVINSLAEKRLIVTSGL